MQPIPIADARVLVLVEGDGGQASNTAGHLFEDFMARLMHLYGYAQPTTRNLRTTSRGIALDISLRHSMANHTAVAECKAYASPVSSDALMKFYGALMAERLEDPDVHGFFVAIPRLTAEGDEKARQITSRDNRVKVLTAHDIVIALRDKQLIVDPPNTTGPVTDHAVIVAEDGVFRSAIQLDPQNRTGCRILVWSITPPIPSRVLDLVSSAPNYGDGLAAIDASTGSEQPPAKSVIHPVADTVIVSVAGSKSNFEYQLPASPKYFVGRSRLLAELEKVVKDSGGVVVLNAQSGWGKSSLALRLKALVAQQGLDR